MIYSIQGVAGVANNRHKYPIAYTMIPVILTTNIHSSDAYLPVNVSNISTTSFDTHARGFNGDKFENLNDGFNAIVIGI